MSCVVTCWSSQTLRCSESAAWPPRGPTGTSSSWFLTSPARAPHARGASQWQRLRCCRCPPRGAKRTAATPTHGAPPGMSSGPGSSCSPQAPETLGSALTHSGTSTLLGPSHVFFLETRCCPTEAVSNRGGGHKPRPTCPRSLCTLSPACPSLTSGDSRPGRGASRSLAS